MFKLYQVVEGKARLCGYNARSKRPLVAKVISLPSVASRKLLFDKMTYRAAWVDGRHY